LDREKIKELLENVKHGKTRELELDTRVFAVGIKVEKLPQDLLSRFTKLHFAPYTEQEFIEVSQRVLTARENTSLEQCRIHCQGTVAAP